MNILKLSRVDLVCLPEINVIDLSYTLLHSVGGRWFQTGYEMTVSGASGKKWIQRHMWVLARSREDSISKWNWWTWKTASEEFWHCCMGQTRGGCMRFFLRWLTSDCLSLFYWCWPKISVSIDSHMNKVDDSTQRGTLVDSTILIWSLNLVDLLMAGRQYSSPLNGACLEAIGNEAIGQFPGFQHNW